jgi:hypothetical protein
MVNQNMIRPVTTDEIELLITKNWCNHFMDGKRKLAIKNNFTKYLLFFTIFSDLFEKVIDLLKGYKCNHSRRYNSDEIGFETFVKPT